MDREKSILIIDDENVVRVTLEALLEKEGYEVTLAERGEEGIEKARRGHFDVALVDLVMPDMDGLAVLDEIKKIDPMTHVIVITGYGSIENAVEAMKKGATDYISKPLKKGEIQGIIKRVLEEARFEGVLKPHSEDVEHGFELFKNLVDHGALGLCVARQLPDSLRERYCPENVSIVQPEDLDGLYQTINDFVEGNDEGVILIVGFEYFIESSLEKLKGFMTKLNNTLSTSSSTLIITYNPEKIDSTTLKDFTNLVTDPYVHLVSEILSNPLRRGVIRSLHDGGRSTFTTIRKELKVRDPPKLSFHLRSLKSAGVVEQDSEKRYFLTQRGERVYGLLRQLDDDGIKDMQNIIWLKSG